MTSFQLAISPNRVAATRFISKVHREIKRAYASKPHITQTAIANKLGVHRSVINRQLRGTQDMTIGRLGELAWALGMDAAFTLSDPPMPRVDTNIAIQLRMASPQTTARIPSGAMVFQSTSADRTGILKELA